MYLSFVMLIRLSDLHLNSAVLLHVNDILYAIPSLLAPIQNKILYFEIFHFVHSLIPPSLHKQIA